MAKSLSEVEVSSPTVSPNLDSKLRTLALATAAFLLTLRLDGWKAGNYETLVQVVLLPYTALFIFLLIAFVRPAILKSLIQKVRPSLIDSLEKADLLKLLIVIAVVFELVTFGLLILETKVFGRFGYSLNLPVAIVLFALIIGGLVWWWLQRNPRLDFFLYYVLAAYSLVNLLSIIAFPLSADRSDMLPIMARGSQNLLNGHDPYSRAFSTMPPSGNYLDYLPDNWLIYFPGVWLKFDIRLINLVLTLAAALIVYSITSPKFKLPVVALLTIFLLNPFFQYHHELYQAPDYLAYALILVCLVRRKPLLAAIVFGWAVAMSPFNWVILPFFLLYVFRTYGLGKSVAALAIAVLVAAAFVAPFLLWSSQDFSQSMLSSWDKKATQLILPSVNLSYFLFKIIPLQYLKVVQGIALLAVFYLAWRNSKTLADCFLWMAAAMLTFILLNSFIDAYFCFLIFFLLILQAVSSWQLNTRSA